LKRKEKAESDKKKSSSGGSSSKSVRKIFNPLTGHFESPTAQLEKQEAKRKSSGKYDISAEETIKATKALAAQSQAKTLGGKKTAETVRQLQSRGVKLTSSEIQKIQKETKGVLTPTKLLSEVERRRTPLSQAEVAESFASAYRRAGKNVHVVDQPKMGRLKITGLGGDTETYITRDFQSVTVPTGTKVSKTLSHALRYVERQRTKASEKKKKEKEGISSQERFEKLFGEENVRQTREGTFISTPEQELFVSPDFKTEVYAPKGSKISEGVTRFTQRIDREREVLRKLKEEELNKKAFGILYPLTKLTQKDTKSVLEKSFKKTMVGSFGEKTKVLEPVYNFPFEKAEKGKKYFDTLEIKGIRKEIENESFGKTLKIIGSTGSTILSPFSGVNKREEIARTFAVGGAIGLSTAALSFIAPPLAFQTISLGVGAYGLYKTGEGYGSIDSPVGRREFLAKNVRDVAIVLPFAYAGTKIGSDARYKFRTKISPEIEFKTFKKDYGTFDYKGKTDFFELKIPKTKTRGITIQQKPSEYLSLKSSRQGTLTADKTKVFKDLLSPERFKNIYEVKSNIPKSILKKSDVYDLGQLRFNAPERIVVTKKPLELPSLRQSKLAIDVEVLGKTESGSPVVKYKKTVFGSKDQPIFVREPLSVVIQETAQIGKFAFKYVSKNVNFPKIVNNFKYDNSFLLSSSSFSLAYTNYNIFAKPKIKSFQESVVIQKSDSERKNKFFPFVNVKSLSSNISKLNVNEIFDIEKPKLDYVVKPKFDVKIGEKVSLESEEKDKTVFAIPFPKVVKTYDFNELKEKPPFSIVKPFSFKLPKIRFGQQKEKKVGYNAMVKSRSGFVKVNTKPLTKRGALSAGATAVDNTTAMSFKVVERKKKGTTSFGSGSWNFLEDKFRKKKGLYIEKRSFGIDTFGEKTGLKIGKYLKQKRKQRF